MKTGFISIVGRPNVGKSTLLNTLVGEKIAIVSSKPQTTRNRIIGIYNEPDVQFVFVDTPGLHKPKNKLDDYMLREVNEAQEDIDCAIILTEPKPPKRTELDLIERFNRENVPILLCINKTDKYSPKEIAETISQYAKISEYASVIPISSLTNDNVNIIIDELKKVIEDGGIKYYPDEMITDQTLRHMAEEILREKLLKYLNDEIPHGITTSVIEYKERKDKPLTEIRADIICEKSSHKKIIIGQNGQMLKKVASEARADMEKLIGNQVYLECFVKVREDWRDDESFIKNEF